jgi:hypothetical protein
MQAENWGSQENVDSDEQDLSSEELDEILEIRMNKTRARLSQNLENGENPQGKEGIVGKLSFVFHVLRLDLQFITQKYQYQEFLSTSLDRIKDLSIQTEYIKFQV